MPIAFLLPPLFAAAVVLFLCLSFTDSGDSRFLVVAVLCFFAPKMRGRALITLFLLALLAFFHWGVLLAGVLLFAALLADVWSASSRSKQAAGLLAAGLCMMALLFSALPAISTAIDSIRVPPLTLVLPAALIVLLELHASQQQPEAAQSDPVLMIILLALTTCYLLAVALLAEGITYPQAILLALFGGSAVLAMVAIITAPLFAGSGLTLLQHIFTLQVPIEKWVSDISADAVAAGSAVTFAGKVMQRFLRLPGIIGIKWHLDDDSETLIGTSGRWFADLHCPPLFIRLYRRRRASPWDWFNYYLLARISGEYCRAKQREEQHRIDNLSRAMHETGARLTHDIKNILQTLTVLIQTGDETLIHRQLPALCERLETTLAKLQSPVAAQDSRQSIAAADWWALAKARYQHQSAVQFTGSALSVALPAALFDWALDNFIANALIKRQIDHTVHIQVRLLQIHSQPALQVQDSGAAVAAKQAGLLFAQPVESETGFGVGLYQVQLEAKKHAYSAVLYCNEAGKVIFQLAPVDQSQQYQQQGNFAQ